MRWWWTSEGVKKAMPGGDEVVVVVDVGAAVGAGAFVAGEEIGVVGGVLEGLELGPSSRDCRR